MIIVYIVLRSQKVTNVFDNQNRNKEIESKIGIIMSRMLLGMMNILKYGILLELTKLMKGKQMLKLLKD